MEDEKQSLAENRTKVIGTRPTGSGPDERVNTASGSASAVASDHAASTAAATTEQSDYDRAKQLGYTGDSCTECGSMTMVRNGTCLNCTTCGATTGCS